MSVKGRPARLTETIHPSVPSQVCLRLSRIELVGLGLIRTGHHAGPYA